MAVVSKPLSATFKIVNLQNDAIQTFQNFRTDISLSQAEMFLDAVGLIRGGPVGNGFLTVTTELAEA